MDWKWEKDIKYKLIKPLEKEFFSLYRTKKGQTIEMLQLEIDDKRNVSYYILDEMALQPSMSNFLDTSFAKKMRKESYKILEDIEKQGYIEKIN
nr:hypothetical protein [Clostridioides sp.]